MFSSQVDGFVYGIAGIALVAVAGFGLLMRDLPAAVSRRKIQVFSVGFLLAGSVCLGLALLMISDTIGSTFRLFIVPIVILIVAGLISLLPSVR